MFFGFIQPAALAQEYPVIVVRLGIVALHGERLAEMLFGLFIVLKTYLQETHHVIGLGIVRVGGQRFIEFFERDIELVALHIACGELGARFDQPG